MFKKNLYVIYIVHAGHFNWTCVNVLSGSGDPYSTAAAKAFESAAIDNQIDVCTRATYQAGCGKMEAPIKQIMDARCCLVNMVFGQAQDLAALLLEAHKQNYKGEWIMGDNIQASLDAVLNDLERNLDDPSSVHEVLRGMFALVSKEVDRVSPNMSHCHRTIMAMMRFFVGSY